jgi:outer membrane protein OmpA-like peptidoglycan-associated protein
MALVVALAIVVPAACSSSKGTASVVGTSDGAPTSSAATVTVATTSAPGTSASPGTTVSPGSTASPGTTAAPAATTTTAASCGTDDLGGGLQIVLACGATPADLDAGVSAPSSSVLLLPDPSLPELEPFDVTSRQARTTTGKLATIYIFGSDTLFDSGSATLRSTADPALTGALASIDQRFAGASIIVRGHTDSVGSADANLALSRQRAEAVAAFLGAKGVEAARLTTVGLGSTVPAANETVADGSVSELGRQLNRRVELVVLSAG